MIRREYPSPLTGINNWKQLSKPEMKLYEIKTLFHVFQTARLITSFAWCLAGPSVAQAADRDPLFPGTVRPGRLDYRTELRQGYLKVYSAIDEFKDGDAWYFPHSSYEIYTIGGKLLKERGKSNFAQR